MQNYSERL